MSRRYWTYVENHGGRDEICDGLAETIRSHYDRLERIAQDVEWSGRSCSQVNRCRLAANRENAVDSLQFSI